jgi:hypothetical protein
MQPVTEAHLRILGPPPVRNLEVALGEVQTLGLLLEVLEELGYLVLPPHAATMPPHSRDVNGAFHTPISFG